MSTIARAQRRSAAGRLGRGAGVAVVFNLQARKVTFAAVEAVGRALPDAALVVTRSLSECRHEVQRLAARKTPVRLLLSAGGDGAVSALINAWAITKTPLPPLGLLPLGTGNAWAHATHAPKLEVLLDELPTLRWPLPTRRFTLLDVGGTLCQFAGTGWDAKLLADYRRHKESAAGRLLPRPLREGLLGYLTAGFRFTVPESFSRRRAIARVTSDEKWWSLGPREELLQQPPGAVWRGAYSVLAMGTTPQFGFHFEAFPFASEVPGTINLRVYDRPIWRAVPMLPRLWRGAHPLAGMHDFFVKRVRITVDPPMPFQLAGDAAGTRDTLEVRLADTSVDVVDWLGATWPWGKPS